MLQAAHARTVLGLELGETIGEGAHGKVKLAIDPTTRQAFAVKLVRRHSGEEGAQALAALHKEIKIHAAVRHENIISLLNAAEDDAFVYLVLEYAAAGELFDRIEPDVGVEETLAHMYFQQLLLGLMYLHKRGISHRDLKPENILLDHDGNLKITDFGLATVFMHNGNRRTLTTPCGTPPYVAPEIHLMNYNGDAVDIWAVGIILYVLLAGNTPWGEPTKHDQEFVYFLHHYKRGLRYEPWQSFPPHVQTLIKGILNVDPAQRYQMEDLLRNPWVCRPNPFLTDGKCNNPALLAERMISNMGVSSDDILHPMQMVSHSQPTDMRADAYQGRNMLSDDKPGLVSFSQPMAMAMENDSATQNTQNQSQSQYERGCFSDRFPSVRLTRFYSHAGIDVIREKIEHALEELLVQHKTNPVSSKITFTTVDRRKCPMHGEVHIQPVGSDMRLVAFRKSKGDPLEFKRFYRAILSAVDDLVVN
ncbi:hypothetical protein PhCBS80983_g04431 [Powellomyces hirtus]|uniref:Protein kinase domain-containing protein n=1 Tax=Powellomyces hirtus TaxID=109895 RepID=A0A507DXU6_9FUNG|nr:hypothetical protein PhCBS80983_g04431 [Powellomyces hirtus]